MAVFSSTKAGTASPACRRSSHGFAFSSGVFGERVAELKSAAIDQCVGHTEHFGPSGLVEIQTTRIVAGTDAERINGCRFEDAANLVHLGVALVGRLAGILVSFLQIAINVGQRCFTRQILEGRRIGFGEQRKPTAAAGLRQEVAIRLAAERFDGHQQKRGRRE